MESMKLAYFKGKVCPAFRGFGHFVLPPTESSAQSRCKLAMEVGSIVQYRVLLCLSRETQDVALV